MAQEQKLQEALKKYAELMAAKIKEVESSDWKTPWVNNSYTTAAQNINGRKYNNMNQVVLSLYSEAQRYKVPVFLTFKQAQEMNLHILKNSKAFPVIFQDYIVKDKDDKRIKIQEYMALPKEEKELYTVSKFNKVYPVFNVEQTNFPSKFPVEWEQMQERCTIETHSQGDNYINPALDKLIKDKSWVCPIEIKEQDLAAYSWKEDTITLPNFEQFPDRKEFYYTALHEMAHSTGHKSRLNRVFGSFGDERYAREELVAELTSSFVGKSLGMHILPRKENAQYLKCWLETMQKDPNFLYSTLKDTNSAISMIEASVSKSSFMESSSESERPEILSFRKDNDGVVYIQIKEHDGNPIEKLIYKRGSEHCFTTGDIVNGNLKTHFLTKEESAAIEGLKGKANDLRVSTSRKTLKISNNKATIEYAGKEYDASSVLKTLEKHEVKVADVNSAQWERLLKGQGLQLSNSSKAVFSICKTPCGYGMKVMNVAKSITKTAEAEA